MTTNDTPSQGPPDDTPAVPHGTTTASPPALPPYVMAGVARIMIGEALRPDGPHVPLDEAVRWLDFLDSTTRPEIT